MTKREGMNRTLVSLMLMFFAGSWLSNHWTIKTTTALLHGASIELILAVSSLAGLAFFTLVRFLGTNTRSTKASWLMLPSWALLEVLSSVYPQYPVWPAIGALLFGELVKWHAYSQVLNRFGPLSAGRILGWVVLAYEMGTITAAFTTDLSGWSLKLVELFALAALYWPALSHVRDEEEVVTATTSRDRPPAGILTSLLMVGVLAGFLKVSADTGFKYALRLENVDMGQAVANFYLVSASFTLLLGVLRRMRWMTPRMGCPKASLKGIAISQGVFALALFSGNIYALIAAAALQRSVDKIFYQPTVQLLASGFNPSMQESIRRWHVTAFLAFGSVVGLVAFSGHELLRDAQLILAGMTIFHLAAAFGLLIAAGVLVNKIVYALDEATRRAGALGGSRPMAMLALLSPRHFLVHALVLSGRKGGGMQGLPPEILQGLTAEAGGEVVESFYAAFPKMDDQHQLALVRLAVFLDRKADHAFLLSVAAEEILCCLRARRLAALHVVKIHGRVYRPLLRRSRGKKSPMPANKKAA